MADEQQDGVFVGRKNIFISSTLIIAVITLLINTVLQVQNKIATVEPQSRFASAEAVENIKADVIEGDTRRKVIEVRLDNLDQAVARIITTQDIMVKTLERIELSVDAVKDLIIKHMLEKPQ